MRHRDMNAKNSVIVFCVEAIIYSLLYNLHDCTFKSAITAYLYSTWNVMLSNRKTSEHWHSYLLVCPQSKSGAALMCLQQQLTKHTQKNVNPFMNTAEKKRIEQKNWLLQSFLCYSPGETRFLICKSKILLVKNVKPSQHGLILQCNQKCLF